MRLINVLAASSINNSIAGSGIYSFDETFELANGVRLMLKIDLGDDKYFHRVIKYVKFKQSLM